MASSSSSQTDRERPAGQWVRTFWYEHGKFDPKPFPRLRVSSPEAVVHDEWSTHPTLADNGLALIETNLLPTKMERAEVYLECWAGHPGTINQRVTLNGKGTYRWPVPPLHMVGHCYPTFEVRLHDLCRGVNALQFACDERETFWGHFLLDQVALRATLPSDADGLPSATPTLSVEQGDGEQLALKVEGAGEAKRVEFRTRHLGFDENGNGLQHDWHGFTIDRRPIGIAGTAEGAPWQCTFDTSMLPDQATIDVMATVFYEGDLSYEISPTTGVVMPPREGRVMLLDTLETSGAMWVRDNAKQHKTFHLPVDPGEVEKAELHVSVWDGGVEHVDRPFTLNGHPLEITSNGDHKAKYHVVPLTPAMLQAGENRIEVTSDTHHHGIEVLWPGPGLVVRTK